MSLRALCFLKVLPVTLLLSLGVVSRFAHADGLGPVRILTPSVQRYGKVVITSIPDRPPDNPFHPGAVLLDAEITLPTGKILTISGFWSQEYRRTLKDPDAAGNDRIEVLEKFGPPEWRVRFSSGEEGKHRVVLKLRDRSGLHSSDAQELVVASGAAAGPVRVSPRNPLYLEHESGRPFFPIGLNLCMYQRREGTYYFERILEKLRAGGGNYVRLSQEYYVPRDLKIVARAGDADFRAFRSKRRQPASAAMISNRPGAWTTSQTSASAPMSTGSWPLR